jgi:hypothetical protein
VGFLRNTLFGEERTVTYSPLSWDQYQQFFNFQGNYYPYGLQTTYPNSKEEPPEATFVGYARALYKTNPVLFACAMVRLSLFSEARFQFRQLRSGRPGDLFGSTSLSILETPWPNGTTGDLLARAIQDADIAGNFYAARRGQYLRRMRPDWVTIVFGSELEREDAYADLDAQILGYVYQPGGAGSKYDPIALFPEQVCHFMPIPDPEARFRGMSWIESIVRELMADNATTSHKLSYFEQGATVNLHVDFDTPMIKTQEQFESWVEMFRRGRQEAGGSTVFTAHGSKITAIGSNLQEADFKTIQGAGETRIAAAARTPAVLVGISEGLQGSALNSGNYDSAFRQFADMVMRPLWRNFCGSMSPIIEIPAGSELWYDDRDIPALREDVKKAAEVLEIDSRAIKGLVEAGFTPEAVVDAVVSGDLTRLKHTGLLSVQMQKPGEAPSSNGSAPEPAQIEA